MKKYILITADIHTMGGMQKYVKDKAEYLEGTGWKVYILFIGTKTKGCVFPELDQYVNGGLKTLHTPPEKIYGSLYYMTIIDEMLEIIEYSKDEEGYYLIESQAEYEAVWGELLAEIIGAKHIFFTCNERFRGKDKHYVDYMDFLKWKYQRRELAGGADNTMCMLFEDFMPVESSPRYTLIAARKDNVSEIQSDIVSNIPEKEWNISYLGRCEKEYFPKIVEEIEKFAVKYALHEIQFIVISNPKEQERKILEGLSGINNLTVTCTGFFSVLPQKLFEKTDVMIAGSGCAILSARQGVPTIVADARTYQAIGGYGYTTDKFLYGDTAYSYEALLEDVLIDKQYLKAGRKESCFILNAEEEYEKFFTFVEKSEQRTEYYSFAFKSRKSEGENYLRAIEYFLNNLRVNSRERKHFANWIFLNYGRSLGLFGMGKVGKLIVETIPELKFAEIYDNHAERVPDKGAVFPSEQALGKVETVLISPILYQDEIKNQLQELIFQGTIITFTELIFQYIESKFH